MKRVLIAAIAAGLATSAIPSSVVARPVEGSSCGTSYMILPNGKCLSLDYMSFLAASRSNVANASAAYQRQFNANVQIEIGKSLGLQESEKSEQARYKNLAATQKATEDTKVIGQQIEDMLYPVHQRAMAEVWKAHQQKR